MQMQDKLHRQKNLPPSLRKPFSPHELPPLPISKHTLTDLDPWLGPESLKSPAGLLNEWHISYTSWRTHSYAWLSVRVCVSMFLGVGWEFLHKEARRHNSL